VVYHPEGRAGGLTAGDTIAAVATPPGVGGVGIVRLSGPMVPAVCAAVTGRSLPPPRLAAFRTFLDEAGWPIDEGLVLFFPAPNSFTGEDVLELQGHGGPVVLDLLLQRVVTLGARLARPGEFSERAFLNGKIDLVQAEAIADLVESASADAARLAVRTLEGEFSRCIDRLVEALIHLRMYVEAAIDFPEEEVDFLSDGTVGEDLSSIRRQVGQVIASAKTGVILREGMRLVIAGRPNAGKSSLMNALAGRESAIVTEIPGTTRDVLREQILVDGMPVHLVDTAGLRETADQVEQEGVRRARSELAQADLILWVFDDCEPNVEADLTNAGLPADIPLALVRNKIDKSGSSPGLAEEYGRDVISLSAKGAVGIDYLRGYLKQRMGYAGHAEGAFAARRRHLDALQRAQTALQTAAQSLQDHRAGELVAEDLRQAQHALSEITGAFTADDLLGKIFSSFCIGK